MRSLFVILSLLPALATSLPALASTTDRELCQNRAPGHSHGVPAPAERAQACTRVLVTLPPAERSHWLAQRGESYRDMQQHALALADHQAAFTAASSAFNYFRIVEDLIALGRYDEALASIERIQREDWLAHYRDNGDYHEWRGRILAKAGRRDEAVQALRTMLRQRLRTLIQSGGDPGTRNRSGEDLLAEQERAAGLPTIIPEARLSRCTGQGDVAQRILACNGVVFGDWVPDEDIRTARFARAQLHAQSQDWPQALADLDWLVQDDAANGDARLLRARVKLAAGKVDEALAEYTWLVDRTGDPQVILHRAEAYFAAKRYEAALADLRAVDARMPGNARLQSMIRQVEQARDAAANPSGG